MKSVVKKAEEEERRPSSRAAHLLSEVFNPLFIALPTFLVIAIASAPDLAHALLWWLIAVLGVSIAPFLFVMNGVRRGRLSDHHVSQREQRFIPLIFGLVCITAAFVLLIVLGASHVLLATITAVIATLFISTIITQFWKISLHLVGTAGAVTVFVLMFGPLLLLLSPLVALVAWARWRVGAHTPLQALAGIVLAVAVTVVTFRLFGIL